MTIPSLAKPNTARRKAVSRVHARARACVAREQFGKYLSPSPTRPGMPCTKAFRPATPMNLPSSILHRTFIYPSPPSGEGSVKVPCPFAHAGTAREPLFTGTFSISGEGEGYFFNSQCHTLAKPKSPRLSMNTKNRGIYWMSRRIIFFEVAER